MAKAPTGPEKSRPPVPPKSKKLPRKLPEDPVVRLWDIGDIVKRIEYWEQGGNR
jgi:hypothetical protein